MSGLVPNLYSGPSSSFIDVSPDSSFARITSASSAMLAISRTIQSRVRRRALSVSGEIRRTDVCLDEACQQGSPCDGRSGHRCCHACWSNLWAVKIAQAAFAPVLLSIERRHAEPTSLTPTEHRFHTDIEGVAYCVCQRGLGLYQVDALYCSSQGRRARRLPSVCHDHREQGRPSAFSWPARNYGAHPLATLLLLFVPNLVQSPTVWHNTLNCVL